MKGLKDAFWGLSFFFWMGICKVPRCNGLEILVPKHLWKSKIGPLQLILATKRYVTFFWVTLCNICITISLSNNILTLGVTITSQYHLHIIEAILLVLEAFELKIFWLTFTVGISFICTSHKQQTVHRITIAKEPQNRLKLNFHVQKSDYNIGSGQLPVVSISLSLQYDCRVCDAGTSRGSEQFPVARHCRLQDSFLKTWKHDCPYINLNISININTVATWLP